MEDKEITPPSSELPTKPPRSRLKRFGIGLFFTVSVILIGILGSVLYVSAKYDDTMLPNTTIGGQDVSGLTLAEATTLLDQNLMPAIDLSVGDQTISADPLAIGITWPTAMVAKEAFTVGHGQRTLDNLWDIARTFFTSHDFDLPVEINETVLNTYVDEQIGSLITEPKDATLTVVNSQIIISDELPGVAIDLAKLKQDIKLAVQKQTAAVPVNTQTVEPAVTKADLTPYKKNIEQYAQLPVVITANNQSVTLSLTDKLGWFNVQQEDKKITVVIDKEAVAKTVAKIAKQVDVKAVNQRVYDTGSVAEEGSDGLSLNQMALTEQLATQMTQSLTQAPANITLAAVMDAVPKKVITVPANAENVQPLIDTELRFAQVSLGQQKMYLFENHQLINVFPISSGKAGYETPKGVHKIYNKARRPLSRTYGMYLPYWNAITADGGYGIHELPEWPSGYKEGENHLGVAVSHGCMRLGVGVAAYFYEWAPLGMAVVIY